MQNFNQLFLTHASALHNTPVGTIPVIKRTLAHGLCFYWAYVFASIHGGELVTIGIMPDNKQYSYGDNHVVVLLNGLYFDGDYPKGRKTIPQYDKAIHKTIKHRSPLYAMKFWQKLKYIDHFDTTVNRIKSVSLKDAA